MAGKRKLEVIISGDAKGLKGAFGDAGKAADGFGSKLGAGVGTVARWGAAAAAAGATAAVAFGVKAVTAASDFNETISQTGVVFGDSSKVITGAADEMARKFGVVKGEFIAGANNLGLLAKGAGFTQDAAAKLGTDFARLAADASSFYNVPVAQALEDIRSGLSGESEPLKKYGVLLSESAVKAKALEMGLAGAGGELSDQAKMQARAALITEKMADASGDLERTQDSLANRFRALKGRAQNFAVTVGTALLPVVSKAFDAFERVSEVVGPVLSRAFGNVRDAVAPLIGRISELTQGEYGLIKAFQAGVKHNGRVEEDMNRLEAVIAVVGGAFTRYRDLVADVFGQVREAVGRFVATFQQWIGENEGRIAGWQAKIQEIVGKIAPLFASAFEAVRTIVQTVLTVVMAFWDRFGRHIMDFAARTFGRILEIVSRAFDILRGIFEVIVGVLTGDWSRAWEGIKSIVSGAWGIITGVVSGAWDTIKTIFGAGIAVVSQAWSGLWRGIKGVAEAVGRSVLRFFEGIVNGLIDGLNAAIRLMNKIPGVDVGTVGHVNFVNDAPAPISGQIRAFDDGGVVPGPKGSPQLILAHGGETVLPTHKSDGLTDRLAATLTGRTVNIEQVVLGEVRNRAAELDELAWALKTAG